MIFRQLRLRLRKRHKIVNLIEAAWEERYNFDDDMMGNYKPRQFLWLFFKALIFKKKCWHCNGGGRTGYYEPEDCRVCSGFGVNWTGEQEPDWGGMADGMRELELRSKGDMDK